MLDLLLLLVVTIVGSQAIAADKTTTIPLGSTIEGRCIRVHDGDTVTVLVDTQDGKRQASIRLDGIDAPELGQPFATRSRDKLRELVLDRTCRVESRGPDKYGRTVGRVAVDGEDVNSTMLAMGMAWHYKKYDSRQSMEMKETAARESHAGLWQDPNPIPPWDWRKMENEHRKKATEVTK